ncbi:MAG: hypothetical protein M1826_000577 [Phylliscum demangeonii]|nr:MAG: hypothetical protein M1826_000577 [Phylliscum demangeonii]
MADAGATNGPPTEPAAEISSYTRKASSKAPSKDDARSKGQTPRSRKASGEVAPTTEPPATPTPSTATASKAGSKAKTARSRKASGEGAPNAGATELAANQPPAAIAGTARSKGPAGGEAQVAGKRARGHEGPATDHDRKRVRTAGQSTDDGDQDADEDEDEDEMLAGAWTTNPFGPTGVTEDQLPSEADEALPEGKKALLIDDIAGVLRQQFETGPEVVRSHSFWKAFAEANYFDGGRWAEVMVQTCAWFDLVVHTAAHPRRDLYRSLIAPPIGGGLLTELGRRGTEPGTAIFQVVADLYDVELLVAQAFDKASARSRSRAAYQFTTRGAHNRRQVFLCQVCDASRCYYGAMRPIEPYYPTPPFDARQRPSDFRWEAHMRQKKAVGSWLYTPNQARAPLEAGMELNAAPRMHARPPPALCPAPAIPPPDARMQALIRSCVDEDDRATAAALKEQAAEQAAARAQAVAHEARRAEESARQAQAAADEHMHARPKKKTAASPAVDTDTDTDGPATATATKKKSGAGKRKAAEPPLTDDGQAEDRPGPAEKRGAAAAATAKKADVTEPVSPHTRPEAEAEEEATDDEQAALNDAHRSKIIDYAYAAKANQTVDPTANQTAHHTAHHTVDQTADQVADETPDQTANPKAHERVLATA